MAGEEAETIQLLRTPKLSIKNLDDPWKETIRRVMRQLHHERGISLTDIAKLIGNKTSGYTSWLFKQLEIPPRPFEEARLKGIKEKRRKYERRPFDGTDEDRAYLLAMCHGDFTASKPYNSTVRITTSTTHRPMAELFTKLFAPYGHVYQHPRFKKDTQSYEWNLSTYVDNSFEFLLAERGTARRWASETEGRALGYIAGLVDAEGNIAIYGQHERTVLMIAIYNTSLELLNSAKSMMVFLGYRPTGPYLDKKRGTKTSKYGIERKKDYWKIVMGRFAESQTLLRRLQLRHGEKVAKQQLAVTLSFREEWSKVKQSVEAMKNSADQDRDEFVHQAELQFLRTHPKAESTT